MPGLPLKHGTHRAYNEGCRCDVCREYHNTYHRESRRRNGQTGGDGWRGRRVQVSLPALCAALNRDGRTYEQFCKDAGIDFHTFDKMRLRGATSERTLDLIACGLGLHMSQLEAG